MLDHLPSAPRSIRLLAQPLANNSAEPAGGCLPRRCVDLRQSFTALNCRLTQIRLRNTNSVIMDPLEEVIKFSMKGRSFFSESIKKTLRFLT